MSEPEGGPGPDRLEAATAKIAQLEQALVSSRRIGIAVGIVMSVHRVDDHRALLAIKTVSQVSNRKMREVAEDIISRGRLTAPEAASGRLTTRPVPGRGHPKSRVSTAVQGTADHAGHRTAG